MPGGLPVGGGMLKLRFDWYINSALSARIAGFLTIGGSLYMNISHTMEELASRGHEVKKQSFYYARRKGNVEWVALW